MNDKPETKVGYVSPLKRICMTIGELPTSYLETMSYYEMLVWFVEFLKNQVIPVVNNNSEATEELQHLFIELQSYVNNYFDNLDVQEEINNKLDEMVEDGTLASIISNYDLLYVIGGKFNADEISSNYTIIKYLNKIVLIDSSYGDNWYRVKNMLDSYGITHIDCFILTHYDTDHAQNFTNGNLMIDGYINSETQLYLPSESNAVSQEKIITIKNLCEEYNLTYNTPTEGEIYDMGGATITFTNCDVAQVNAYYSPSTDANLYATMCLVKHKDTKLLFTADCDNKCFDLLKLNNVINGTVDFITIPHHGFNVTTNDDYLRQINPYIALQEGGSRDFARSSFTACPSITQLINQGCKLVPTFIQPKYVEITSNGYNVGIKQGIIFDTSNYLMETKHIYVDIMTSNNHIQDGTQENPYRELNQALSTINNYNENVITIHLADGTYNTNLGDISPEYLRATNIIQNVNKTVQIVGNSEDNTSVIIKGINARNVNNLIVQNLTIYNEYRHGFEMYNTNCYIDNCIITNPSEIKTYDGIYANNGNVFVFNTTINYANNVLNSVNADIRARNITVNQFNNLYPSAIRGNYTIQSITYTDSDLEYNKNTYFADYLGLRQIYSNNNVSGIGANDTSVEMPIDITNNIKNIKVLLSSSSRNQIMVDCRYPANNKHFPVTITLGSENYTYIITATLSFNGKNILIQNQHQMRISNSDNTITHSAWDSYYYFRILGVWIDENY